MSNEDLKSVIGNNVRRFRHERGLTQERLAELIDRDSSAVTHLERGDRMIGVELLVKLSDVFSVSADALLRPAETTSYHSSISSILAGQSDEALSHLEPIIRAWLTQYGDPKPGDMR